MADRVGVINKGELILAEEKAELMKKLGKKQLTFNLEAPLAELPAALAGYRLALKAEGHELEYTFDAKQDQNSVPGLLQCMGELGIAFKDLSTKKSSLEDIFVDLVASKEGAANGAPASPAAASGAAAPARGVLR
jgi:ABC-2 type transport system ATP-binding protein